MPVELPDPCALLLTGLPGTGKSAFANHLQSSRGFVHFDLEKDRTLWPDSSLHEVWESSRPHFVAAARNLFPRLVLNWGFPPNCLPMVDEIDAAGVPVVWFTGPAGFAKNRFMQREGITSDAAARFDYQLLRIACAGLPAIRPHWRVVDVFRRDGSFQDNDFLERSAFRYAR